MGFNFASKIFLLHLLLVMCAHGSRTTREMITTKVHREEMMNLNPSHDARPEEDNFLRLPSMNGGIREDKEVEAQDEQLHVEHVHSNPLAHLDHIDKSLLVFFTLNDLQVGNRMQIYFPKRDPLSSPRFLSREEANAIPFSYQQLPYLLEFFSFTPGSPQAIAMENTIRECETKAIKGETKTCATSLESMLDFVQKKLGLETEVKVLSTTHLTKSSTLLQNYTIDGVPKDISAPKMVACHTMPYPYAVFYCHNQESQNKVFLVSLTGDNGDRVEALAVCHMDTSQWSRNHVSFTVLGVEPGSSNVCHFFPDDNLVYVPMPSMASTGYVMNGAGFVSASSECSLDEIADLVYPNPAFKDLVTSIMDQLAGDDQPFCILQVTPFKCGGFAIGTSTNRVTFRWQKSFSENMVAMAADKPLTITPCNDRQLLAARNPPRVTFPHPEPLKLDSSIPCNAAVFHSTEEPLDFEIFRLSSRHIFDGLTSKTRPRNVRTPASLALAP